MDSGMTATTAAVVKMRQILQNLDGLLEQVENKKITYRQIYPELKAAFLQMERVDRAISFDFFLRDDFERYLQDDRKIDPELRRLELGRINKFSEFIAKDLTEIDKHDVTCFTEFLKKRDPSRHTVYKYRASLRRYFNWLACKIKKQELIHLFGESGRLSCAEFFLRDDYERYLQDDRKLVPCKISIHLFTITKFAKFIAKDLTDVEKKDITYFSESLKNRDKAKSTVDGYRSILRIYFNWLACKIKKQELAWLFSK